MIEIKQDKFHSLTIIEILGDINLHQKNLGKTHHICVDAAHLPTLISHLIEMGGVVANAGEVAPEYLSDEAEELLVRILRDYHLVPKNKI